MATASFSQLKDTAVPAETKTETPPVEVPATVATPAPAAEPANEQLAHPVASGIAAGLDGDFDRGDIKLPRINLVQKMSELVNAGFRPGEFVYNKEIPLGREVSAVVVSLRKQFQQDVPFGGDVEAHVCDTLAEVREAGGSTEWGSENHYSEIAHIHLLVKAPAGLAEDQLDAFPYEIDGEHWAPAVYTVAKSAYKSAAKPIITAGFSTLRAGLGNGLWTMTVEEKKNAMGSWVVPVFKLTGRNSAGVTDLVAALNAQG